MTKIESPETAFNAQIQQIVQSLAYVFERLVDDDPGLTEEKRDEAKEFFHHVNDYMARHDMRLAQRALTLIVTLHKTRFEQAGETVRRDGTFGLCHQIEIAYDDIWSYENRHRIRKSKKIWGDIPLKNRGGTTYNNTIRKLERSLCVTFTHDSGEDDNLKPDELEKYLYGEGKRNKFLIAKVKGISEAFNCISKWPDMTEDQYIRNLAKSLNALGTKHGDTRHNFRTLIGSGKSTEEMRRYVYKRMNRFEKNERRIKSQFLLHYFYIMLQDQARLIITYCDVKEGKKPFSELNLVTRQTAIKYEDSSVDERIHNILGIFRRIAADPDIRALRAASIQSLPAPTPVAVPSPRQANDRERLKHA